MEEEFPKLSDAALVVCAAEGNQRAFEVLFERHYHKVFGIAYRMHGNPEDAEDVTQETFIRMAKSLSSFRGDAEFTTWLLRIAMNSSSDHLRRYRRASRIASAIEESALPEYTNVLSGKVLVALQSLSDIQRKAIILTFYEGFNQAQAAKILKRSHAALTWHVYRAKLKLKELLQGEGT